MLALIIAAVVLVGRGDDGRQSSVTIEIAGAEEVVFDWSEQACDVEDFPDVPARAFRDAEGQVQVLASHDTTRRSIGPDLDHLSHDCSAVMTSDRDPDPARFDDREWLHAVYTPDGSTVYALIHNEYHGHRHPGMCPVEEYRPCWYNAVTLATSLDGGDTFTHAEPPGHLVASVPYRYEPGVGPFGIFNPSNIVHNAEDGFYYALVSVLEYRDQPAGTCVIRTDDLADPTSWRAWDGTAFRMAFVNPYLELNVDVTDHVCQPVAREMIQTMRHSVTYNTALDRYLLIGMATSPGAGLETARWGIYFSLSEDLIHWTPRQLIVEDEVPWTFECGDADPFGYPSVIDRDSPSRNFETTDQEFDLYYIRFNYASCEQTPDRDLVRITVRVAR
jgi:hypothetical protein